MSAIDPKPTIEQYVFKELSENEAKLLLIFYNRWKEEIFYRRNRTSFITTWTSTLFIAIIGGKLLSSGSLTLSPNNKLAVSLLILAILLISTLYFKHNSGMHARAKYILLDLEKKFYIAGKDMTSLYPERDDSSVTIAKKYFSERGSFIQCMFVILLAALCLCVINLF